MKKILLGAAACLTMSVSTAVAQQIHPCGTYQLQEYYIKNIPGYKAQMDAKTAAINADVLPRLMQMAAKTSSVSASYTYTIPVVFHILHLGEPVGSGSNIDDNLCVNALALVNKDYARQGADTTQIDPLFEPLYKNSRIHFALAKKDPAGNCTNGIVHHYNPHSDWKQTELYNYEYSTVGANNWSSSKYLNIYIVRNIISSDPGQQGIIVGYTHLPGTAPNTGSDAIVYRNDFLTGTDVRSLSHEIGHWLGLSHTFGSSNNAGSECGNDDIGDTPATTGFFSTCPKPYNFTTSPSVATPSDSSDIVNVALGNLNSASQLNSLTSVLKTPATSGTVTTVTTKTVTVNGTAGSYSDFTLRYPADIAPTPSVSSTYTVSIRSLANASSNNYVAMFMDYNRNGSFADANESVYLPTDTAINYVKTPITKTGNYTFNWMLKSVDKNVSPSNPVDSFSVVPATVKIPTGTQGLCRMRVITSNSPITGPNVAVTNGEYEDYLLNIGLLSCDTIRPNMENIMDYSSCPKMFTQGQTNKMRSICASAIANRENLSDTVNLYNTGIFDRTFSHTYTVQPTNPPGAPVQTVTVYNYSVAPNATCPPIADFYANKVIACGGQSITFNNTSYNSTPVTSYTWNFEGGNPSTSNAASPVVQYGATGNYSVSLTVSNANGTDTEIKNSFVNITWGADPIAYPYAEGFETGVLPQNWSVKNLDFNTVTWESSNYGNSSSKSMVLPNANGSGWYRDNIDILETAPFSFHKATNISVSFDYSYARKSGYAGGEVFKFQYSTDCGGTWADLGTAFTPSVMANNTGSVVTAPYIPFTNKWVTKTYAPASISFLNNKDNVKFRFYFNNDPMTGQAQNLYIDNFNISATVGVEELASQIGLSIYPNPTNASSTVEFITAKDSKVTISVYDMTGRIVEQNQVSAIGGQVSQHAVNKSANLMSGVYFISLTMDGQKTTKKLVVQ